MSQGSQSRPGLWLQTPTSRSLLFSGSSTVVAEHPSSTTPRQRRLLCSTAFRRVATMRPRSWRLRRWRCSSTASAAPFPNPSPPLREPSAPPSPIAPKASQKKPLLCIDTRWRWSSQRGAVQCTPLTRSGSIRSRRSPAAPSEARAPLSTTRRSSPRDLATSTSSRTLRASSTCTAPSTRFTPSSLEACARAPQQRRRPHARRRRTAIKSTCGT
mmetsp:Transcript_24639/g.80532  ORF Transcript_24639/g.80532 Transcript_24639/m.80532 type:complete len:214 (-) Transcript_24639:263-904(-)